ncbi:MAG: hypothetical protein CR988_02290 [Treponema sp.]|nr:MAG: hypothetical protein CR988_02290 [Treponema sp.]
MPTVEDVFTDTKIKTKEKLKEKGEKVLKEKRKEDKPTFEVETIKPIRLFDKVSLVHPETNKIYSFTVEEEKISYKASVLKQIFGLGGVLFNPFSALVKKESEQKTSNLIRLPSEIIARGFDRSVMIKWKSNADYFVVRWKEETQLFYNYRTTKNKKEMFERLENGKSYLFSVAGVFDSIRSGFSSEVECMPISSDNNITNPLNTSNIDTITSDAKNLTLEKPKPTLTAWQNKIIEYDVTDKDKIEMTFEEALYDVIVLKGELKNNFTLELFFDKNNFNGAKDYLVVFKLLGEYLITFTTGIENSKKIQHSINDDMYHMGCFLVVDYQGDVSHFRGEKGASGGFGNIDVANLINRKDYFIIEKEDNAYKVSKVDTFKSIQQFDSPIGEIKEFYDNDYKHGFLECNGLPFSPDVFPDLTEYVKRVFNTGKDDVINWQLRPTLTGSTGRKVYIKAVQGV